MFEFHKDTERYYNMQTANAEKYVIPFIEEKLEIREGMNVLEVGCAEGGVIKAFAKLGCNCVGVELSEQRLENAKKLNKDIIESMSLDLITSDIYAPSFEEKFANKFDLIILKDVIEHIHDQEKIMAKFKTFLAEDGHIFFGFPPFNMPFGGHQQVAQHKMVSNVPYIHLLPRGIYKKYLEFFGTIPDDLLEVKDTGISINRFQRICKNENYTIVNRTAFLLNPIYEFKFGIKARKQLSFIDNIPYLRDFFTTCMYYLIKK